MYRISKTTGPIATRSRSGYRTNSHSVCIYSIGIVVRIYLPVISNHVASYEVIATNIAP